MSRFMLALDGSTLSEQALPHALSLMRPDDELLLVHVVEPPLEYGVPELMSGTMGPKFFDSSAYLDRWTAQLRERGFRVRPLQKLGWPREALVEIAREERADTLVLSSHGRRGASRWLLGSVAESVCRHAPCPTYLVHPGPGEGRPESELLEGAPAVRRLLVPLDTSPLAEEALDYLSHFPGARVTLLVVSEPPEPADLDRLEAHLQGYLDRQSQNLRGRGFDVTPRARTGYAADEILREASEGGFDAVVMATHGRSGMARWLMGSVAERVVRHCPCPVILLRPEARSHSKESERCTP